MKVLLGTFSLSDHSYSGVASYTAASFKLWWDNPFASDGWGILAVCEPRVAGWFVLENSKSDFTGRGCLWEAPGCWFHFIPILAICLLSMVVRKSCALFKMSFFWPLFPLLWPQTSVNCEEGVAPPYEDHILRANASKSESHHFGL